MKSEKNIHENDRIALYKFIKYRKQKQVKERLLGALIYYEDAYDCYYDAWEHRKYIYK